MDYEARVGDATQTFIYAITISGQADGSLSFAAECEVAIAFITNRNEFAPGSKLTCRLEGGSY